MDPDTGTIDPEELKRNLAITLGTQAPQLGDLRHPSPDVAAPGAMSMPGNNKIPDLSVAPPSVKGPRGTLDADKAERSRMIGTGAGEDQIYNKVTGSDFGQHHQILGKILGGLGQGVAKLGDIGLSAVAPALAINLPGTEYHHQMQLNQLNKQIGAQEGEANKEASTANLNAQPEIKQAGLDLQQDKLDETMRQHDQQLREHGFKTGPDGQIVPLPYEEMNPNQQAVHDLKGAQEEEAEATAALKKVQADPNSPQARMAQQRIENARQTRSIALQRLGLSEATFNARYHGTDTQGNALPGAMMTDEGQPVGSSFSQNVRPTGTERNKADMANSAKEQLTDIKSIVHSRPDIFGPVAGRTTDFNVWLGSQDPDAQRFRAARTIAGDHLAGTFGGRSEAALQALDSAIGHFKDNPAALDAGLDQLLKANTTFQKAGSVRTSGSKANASATPQNSSGGAATHKWNPATGEIEEIKH